MIHFEQLLSTFIDLLNIFKHANAADSYYETNNRKKSYNVDMLVQYIKLH